MSAYRGRTGPNYTEFLNTLNTTSPTEDDTFNTDIDLNSNLDMFTNANFTHHDMMPDESFNFDLNNDGNVKFEELLAAEPSQPAFNASTIGNSPADAQFYSNYNTPIQSAPGQGFPALEAPSPISQNGIGLMQQADTSQMQGMSPDERSRVAAEEDKRRRNTAASARFRVKKKQREQALEKSVKEVNDKNSKLEAKIGQLEMENKWLKDLITEKNAVQSREELDAKYLQYKRDSQERDSDHTSGVGTN